MGIGRQAAIGIGALGLLSSLFACHVPGPGNPASAISALPVEEARGGIALRFDGQVQALDGREPDPAIAFFYVRVSQQGHVLLEEKVKPDGQLRVKTLPPGLTRIFVTVYDAHDRNLAVNGGAEANVWVQDQRISPVTLRLVLKR
jgi:hypothetical protein